MNTPTTLLLVLLAPLILAPVSCTTPVGTVYDDYGYHHSRFDPNYRRGRCPVCNQYQCRDHLDYRIDTRPSLFHRKAVDDMKYKKGAYRIADGDNDDKVKSVGYRSPEWYRMRGYDLDRLRLIDQNGNYYQSSGNVYRDVQNTRSAVGSRGNRYSSGGFSLQRSAAYGR